MLRFAQHDGERGSFNQAVVLSAAKDLARIGDDLAMARHCYVYILTNAANRVLYTGVTSGMARRMHEHRIGKGSEFVSRYKATKLVLIEQFPTAAEAIAREKQIKGWRRARKVALIDTVNPHWQDLGSDLHLLE